MDHGYGSYAHGCRCLICRKANADYTRARRKRAREAARAGIVLPASQGWGSGHGLAAFTERGCRCPECRTAYNTSRRPSGSYARRQAQKRAETT